MKRAVGGLCLLVWWLLAPGRTAAEGEDAGLAAGRPLREAANLFGCAASLVAAPPAGDHPYSWMMGGEVFYERRLHLLGASWRLGTRVAAFGQLPLEAYFGRSRTVAASAYLGWEILQGGDRDFAYLVAVSAGAGQYWSWLEHDGELYTASRPLAFAAVGLDLFVGRRLALGVSLEPTVFVDNAPVFGVAESTRVALRF